MDDKAEIDKTISGCREDDLKYAIFFDQSPDGILLIDTEGNFLDFNTEAHRQLGYSRDEFAKLRLSDIDPVESPEEIQKRILQVLNEGKTEFEVTHRTKHGELRKVRVITQSASLSGRQVFHTIWRDVTEQKKTEKALREASTRLETLIQAMPDMIILKAADGRYTVVNKAVEESTGLKQEEFIGKTNNELLPPNTAKMCNRSDDEAIRRGGLTHVEEQYFDKAGKVRFLDTIKVPIHDSKGRLTSLLCVARDITERKLAEERVLQSEVKYRNLFESATDGIFILNLDGNFIDVNSTAYTRLGYTKEEMLALHISRLEHPTFTSQVHNRMLQVREHGAAVFESAHLRKDGSAMPVEVNARLIEYEGRLAYFSVIRDITARKKDEEKLRHSEQFISGILDTVDEGFIVIDREFRILTANKAYCSQAGGNLPDIIGRHCYEISHKTLRPCYEVGEECAVRHVFETGESHTTLHKHQDAKGSILYVETKAFPIKDSTGVVTSVIETVNNITERHLLEKEQLKTQKLEAIGTLAGGIAHDFNNLLQGVFGYISMAKRMHDQKQKSLDMLDQAEKALQMSVNLTSQLLTFSKGGKPLTRRIALRPVIENSVKFALSGSSVDYRIQVDEQIWMVEADEGQIGQVIQNLILNADQAMPMGGTITIMARNVSSRQKELPAVLQQGNYVVISLKDSGIGIPEQYLPNIFDPYFTTKDKGSGLGLATSYSIIKNHGGLIDVKSKLGEGTIFFVYLPAVEAVETSIVTVSENVQACRKGRILLMDDEDIVRNIAGIMISSLDHEVELAEDGEEAIAKYRESMKTGRRFDIVIMDLTIRGGMGGEEAIKELLQIDPHIRAIVSSGYTDNSAISEYKTIGFKACLTKPYDIDSLNATLNSLLD